MLYFEQRRRPRYLVTKCSPPESEREHGGSLSPADVFSPRSLPGVLPGQRGLPLHQELANHGLRDGVKGALFRGLSPACSPAWVIKQPGKC